MLSKLKEIFWKIYKFNNPIIRKIFMVLLINLDWRSLILSNQGATNG